jgi:hypothetical protein
MRSRIDLAVSDRFQRLTLTVEVKKKFGATEKWAAETRVNLVVHGFYPIAPYFLLVTPEKFFLWTSERNNLEETLPNYVADAQEQLKPYLDELGFNLEKIDTYIFEQVVSLWLKYSVLYPKVNTQKANWLEDSGLAKDILYGNLLLEVGV